MIDWMNKKTKVYSYILVVFDISSEQGCVFLPKTKLLKLRQWIFSYTIHRTKREPSLTETDDGKEYKNKSFTEFLFGSRFKSCSWFTSKRAVFAERFDRETYELLKEPDIRKRKCK